jgi:hypothetical protein
MDGRSGLWTTLRLWSWRLRRSFSRDSNPGKKKQLAGAVERLPSWGAACCAPTTAKLFAAPFFLPDEKFGRIGVEVRRSGDAGGLAGFGLAVGYGGFGDAEAGGGGSESGPVGAFVGEEEVVDVAVRIRCAAEGGPDFGCDGESGEDLFHGAVEDGVGDGEQAHEEEVGAFYGDGR